MDVVSTIQSSLLGSADSGRFQTTCWSDIVAAADVSRPGSGEALASVCSAYWYPVYAYARGCGLKSEDAQDLTQAFFAQVIEKEFLATADSARGRFRWYLLASVQNFLRSELVRAKAQKRGGNLDLLSWDALEAEQRFAAEPVEAVTPDLLFDRNWALAVMSQALKRLENEFRQSGRLVVFEQLKCYLEGAVSKNGYDQPASFLGLSVSAVKVTVHRMRDRFRQMVREEITRTVVNVADVEDELRHLAQLVAL